MSWYTETGQLHGGFVPTYGAVGASCAGCFSVINNVDGCRLFKLTGDYYCKTCITEMLEAHKYARQGYCEECTKGYDTDADRAEHFVTCTVLPWGNKSLCIDCILEQLEGIDADDPADNEEV